MGPAFNRLADYAGIQESLTGAAAKPVENDRAKGIGLIGKTFAAQ